MSAAAAWYRTSLLGCTLPHLAPTNTSPVRSVHDYGPMENFGDHPLAGGYAGTRVTPRTRSAYPGRLQPHLTHVTVVVL